MILTSRTSLNYQNERGLTIDLVPLTGDTIDRTYILWSCSTQLETEFYSEPETEWHGETIQPFFMQARYLEIRGFINYRQASKESIYDLKRNVERTFNPTIRGKLTHKKIGRNRHRFLSDCVPTSKVVFSEDHGLVYFTVNLKAFMPFWQEDVTLERVSFTQKSLFYPRSYPPILYVPDAGVKNGKMFYGLKKPNLDLIINNVGDVESGFKLVFSATGHLETPSFKNAETGATLTINKVLEKGETITIISFPQQKSIIINENKANEDKKGFKYLKQGSQFFSLPAGQTKIDFWAELNTSFLDVFLYYTPLFLGAE